MSSIKKHTFVIASLAVSTLTVLLSCNSGGKNEADGREDVVAEPAEDGDQMVEAVDEIIDMQEVEHFDIIPEEIRTDGTQMAIPHYFIAIHNEPLPGQIETLYPVLASMVEEATSYNVKLTIMLTPQWAEFITSDSEKLDELHRWKSFGHEIAAHHHSIYHGRWDGYTNYSQARAFSQRAACGRSPPEQYLGTLDDDYRETLLNLDPHIVTCCCNDEADKNTLPDFILYDTCSGFSNNIEPWQRQSDTEAEKGINNFVATGTWNSIERKWLTHYQAYRDTTAAIATFDSMDSGLYGAVFHSNPEDADALSQFLALLHERDPEGSHSMTVREAIESGTLPQKQIPDSLLQEIQIPERCDGTGLCGDGLCDSTEQANPDLCPEDCR